jgi:hypothetical protein
MWRGRGKSGARADERTAKHGLLAKSGASATVDARPRLARRATVVGRSNSAALKSLGFYLKRHLHSYVAVPETGTLRAKAPLLGSRDGSRYKPRWNRG